MDEIDKSSTTIKKEEREQKRRMTKTRAGNLYREMIAGKNLKDVSKPKPQPFIQIFEHVSDKGETTHYSCKNHVNESDFIKNCLYSFYVKPSRIIHTWQRTKGFRNKYGDDEDAQKRRDYVKQNRVQTQTVACDSNDKGAEPITIGFKNG